MTSNLGVKLQDFGRLLDSIFNTNLYRSNEELVGERVGSTTPEFLNRVDEVVIFNPSENEVGQIVEIELAKLDRRLNRLGYEVTIDKKVKFLSEVGFDEKYEARPIKGAIQKNRRFDFRRVLRGNITEGVPCKLKMKGKEEVILEKGK